ncbi:protein transport protein S31 [Agyrium rufum]|nr:protein transport protein S31 [Agyrium rufum]
MVKVREIPRTATFAWSPGALPPLLATGTRAGAVDADFSSETQLELWDLDLGNSEQGVELQPKASIATDSRFHDIAWVQPKDGPSRGYIAGALENGSLDLWNADNLISGTGDALVSRTSKHSGAIKALQFNPFRSELLATAGAKGELFISDLNNIGNPFRLGNTAARADDFECLDWNKKVPHIMVTGSSGGFVTVWDVKAKKESLTLNNLGRKPVSAVAWDPEKSTRLITAVSLDTDPLILVWDLRNSNAPERVLRGHEGGVLSLSWCRQDSDLLLSCGKDNRTICWNPQTGDAYGELPIVTNWTFQTRWNPHNPGFLATASFDGKVAVQTVQSTNAESAHVGATQNQALEGEDFFNNAQSQPQTASFSLNKAPKWLARPCGATFGFGGKVISFKSDSVEGGSIPQHSTIKISEYVVDAEIETMTRGFEKAMKDKDLKTFCDNKITQVDSESEKNDWRVIETLISQNPRQELVKYLGLTTEEEPLTDDMSNLSVNGDAKDGAKATDKAELAKKNRLSAFFDNDKEGENFLADLAATKGAKTNNPFHIYSGEESDSDKKITQALMLGQFSKAMEICLREDRLSDAFMIAICGGQECIEKVQKVYFMKQEAGPNYLRLLASVVGKNLWDLVYNADLENWREVMTTLCTYASAQEFPDLCEALGDRLEEQLSHDSGATTLRSDSSFCYIAGSKLEKVVKLWIADIDGKSIDRDLGESDAFSKHARSLQNFIEKVTVFREVTHYQDTDRKASSDWKLAPLYDLYTEYADIIASHGQLETASRYLELLPSTYPAAEVARNRVKQATRNAPTVTTTAAKQPSSMLNPAVSRAPAADMPVFEDQRTRSVTPATSARNNYAPTINHTSDSYQPQSSGQYTPSGYGQNPQMQQPSRNPYGAQAQYGGQTPSNYGAQPQPGTFMPPPRAFNASPSIPPPPKVQTGNWNDIPDNFVKPPTSRRGTPGLNVGSIQNPFPNAQPQVMSPPMASPFGQSRAAPPPPPPKGPAPPPKSGTPLLNGQSTFSHPERPTSSSASMYAPQQPSMQIGQSQPSPQVPRGPSPYNAPPSSQPAPGRYAPAPAAQAPMPSAPRGGPPPPNPYAPSQSSYAPRRSVSGQPPQDGLSMGPSPSRGPPPQSSGPPQGLSQGPPQGAPQDRPESAQPMQSERRPTKPTGPKYPPGDRHHIPANAMPVYEILNEDMQRVKAKAPASFKSHVLDAEKRLNILFDHLNNETLLKPDTISGMTELAQAIRGRDYDQASAIQLDLHTNRTEECGNWMVGVKRLISMSRATP